ncbi:MAG TPA: hypothetical protein VL086_15375 [Candidatus Nitrosotalea sp.]|nr:hypothetical protein [Candidatus Nitrosotalea sp.]
MRDRVRLLLGALLAAGGRVLIGLGQAFRLGGRLVHLPGRLLATLLTWAAWAGSAVIEAARLGVGYVAHLGGRLHLLVAILLAWARRAGSAVIEAARLGVGYVAHLGGQLRLVLRISHALAARATTVLAETTRLGVARVALLRTHLRRLLSIPVELGGRVVTGLASIYRSSIAGPAQLRTRLGSLRLRPRATRANTEARTAIHIAVARAGDLCTRLRGSFSISLTTVARVVGGGLVVALALYILFERPVPGPATIALQDPSEGSDPSIASTLTPHTWQVAVKPPAVHVVGRLSVKDRSATERDLYALLVQTGGTQLGKRQDVRITVVDAVVPQSVYKEFTHGLARIGSWQVEAERSPLPKGVHMTIRVGE